MYVTIGAYLVLPFLFVLPVFEVFAGSGLGLHLDLEWTSRALGRNVLPHVLHSSKAFLLKSSKALIRMKIIN